MTLIDSSAWIEYYSKTGLEEIMDLVSDAIRKNEAAINGIVHVEILAYASRDQNYDDLRTDFSSFLWIKLSKTVFDLAVEMGRLLRTIGLTVPTTDLIVASSARDAEASLLHYDAHFEKMADHVSLTTISPLKKGEDSSESSQE